MMMTTASLPRSCLKDRGSKQAAGSHTPNNNHEIVDLATLMQHVDRLFILVSPFATAALILSRVCRWKSPPFCILLLSMINGTCMLLPAGFQLLVTWTFLAGVAGIGYTHMRTGCLVKVFPNPDNRDDNHIVVDEQTDEHAKLVQQFKTLLLHINTVVSWCCYLLSKFYAVLKFENLALSIGVHCGVSVLFGCLYLLPLRWNVALGLDTILLYIPVKMYAEQKYQQLLEAYRARALRKKAAASRAATPESEVVSLTQTSCSSSEPMYDKGSDTDNSVEKLEEDSSEYSENESLETSSEVKDTEAKRSGVMGKIRELKKKRLAAAVNCTGCSVAFTAILKRRHVCTYCGYQYCSKCCSQRVPKKLFGVTSPSAQTETVPVCQQCHIFLTGTKESVSVQ